MFASVEMIESRGRDESLKRFVDARDLPPELQQETLEQLFRSSSGELRQRALRAGAILLGDEALVALLRNDADDVLRNAGLEMLKLRGRRAFGIAVALLADNDADVVLQAVLVLDALRDPRAWSHLRALLQHEDANVVQATIMAAGHLAGASAAQDLVPFLSGDPWLQAAAVQALGDLRSPAAVPNLEALLPDPFLQVFAAEALTRVGNTAAYRALADYWLGAEAELDSRFFLELLAAMLTQFERPPGDERLRAAAEHYLGSSDRDTAAAAAWCLLALGTRNREAALDVIAATTGDLRCPPCLAARSDLAGTLIRRDAPLRDWGYEILARFPAALAADAVAAMLDEFPPEDTAAAGAYLARCADPVLARPLLKLWIERRDDREALVGAVRLHSEVLGEMSAGRNVSVADRLALLDAAGVYDGGIIGALDRLNATERWEAIGEVRSREVVSELPWTAWLGAETREEAARAMAEAASRTHCAELLPLIRSELAGRPQRELVQAAGDLRDRDSVPILAALLRHTAPLLRAAIFDSLGRIGGATARALLRSYCVAESPDAGQACRALAMCATRSDAPLLRAAADSNDLSVRLALVPPLASFGGEENERVLRRLLFDPSFAVAHKAQTALEAGGAA